MFMKKLINEQNLKREKVSGLFLAILLILVATLSVGRVVIANRLVEFSERLRALDKTIVETRDKNQILAESLRAPQSLTVIEDKAKALGFVNSGRLIFLTPAAQVALLR